MSTNKQLITGLSMVLATFAMFATFGQALAADNMAGLDSKAPCEKPVYPRASLVNEEKGTVLLAFLISADGKVVESKIEKSTGFKNLDKAAMAALSQCKFIPASKGGKTEQGWAKVEYTWKLE